jgi:hypothetical protein
MDSRVVNKEIRAAVWPVLRLHGFATFTSRTAWRHSTTRIDVVNFQSFNDYVAAAIAATTYSFSVNIAQYCLFVPSDDFPIQAKKGVLLPKEYECHLRYRALRRLRQPELDRQDTWYIDPDGAYLTSAVQDARGAILDTGLPWFDRHADDAALLDILLTTPNNEPDGTLLYGNNGSANRNLLTGYLLWALGRKAEARERLSQAYEQYTESHRRLQSSRSRWRPPTHDRLARDVALLAAGV